MIFKINQNNLNKLYEIISSIKWDFENNCILTNNLPKKLKEALK